MNTSENQNQERIDNLERVTRETGIPQPMAVLRFNDAGGIMYEYAKQQLAPKLREALEDGIPLVIIAGKAHDYNGNRNYDWLLELYKTLSITEFRPKTGPASLSCTSPDRAVKDLYEEFQSDLVWEASYKNLDEEARRLLLIRIAFGRGKGELPQFHPLFLNVKKDPVAFTLQVGKGELVLLPNIDNIEIRSRYIEYILNEFLPQFRPAWFSDRWTGTYTPAVLEEKESQLQVEKERMLRKIQEQEKQLEDQRHKMKSFIDLLTQADSRLVEAVQRAFQDLLGIKVVDLDAQRDEEGKPRLFDLIATIEGKHFAIEIKGGQRSLKKAMLDQTEDNVQT
jgi:hypothetical protein